jgi:hypothetical protein
VTDGCEALAHGKHLVDHLVVAAGAALLPGNWITRRDWQYAEKDAEGRKYGLID